MAFVNGSLTALPRMNCWSIAEHAGEERPHGMRRLLPTAVRDEAGIRDDLRGYVLEHFADLAAVVVDETGDLKRGQPRWGYSGSTPAPPGGPRTRRSPSTWPVPPVLDGRRSPVLGSGDPGRRRVHQARAGQTDDHPGGSRHTTGSGRISARPRTRSRRGPWRTLAAIPSRTYSWAPDG